MSRRQKLSYPELVRLYESSLSPEERKRHFVRSKYPAGRGRRGGANRSSSVRREIHLKVTQVALCDICGGATNLPDSTIFQVCQCPPGGIS